MIDVSRLSESAPNGHVNDWPVTDYEAFVAAFRRIEELLAAFGCLVDASDAGARDRLLEQAVGRAMADLGLPRRHWLGDAILAGCFGRFRCASDGRLREAGPFLRFMDGADARSHGAAGVLWAKKLDGGGYEH